MPSCLAKSLSSTRKMEALPFATLPKLRHGTTSLWRGKRQRGQRQRGGYRGGPRNDVEHVEGVEGVELELSESASQPLDFSLDLEKLQAV